LERKKSFMSETERKTEGLSDFFLPFQLDKSGLRGRIARLTTSLDTILGQHAYPLPVARLLAEVSVTATLLASLLKYEGVFSLQTKSAGPVRLLIADVTSAGGLRAYAQFDEAAVKAAAEGAEADLVGDGVLAFTADLGAGAERYQGIVELKGGKFLEAVQRYFRQSEQIQTGVMVAIGEREGHWQGGGLILQRMPGAGGKAGAADTSVEDDWLRALSLMQTCTEAELSAASLPAETLLYRLFHEESPRVFDPQNLRHECRCSQERVIRMLCAMPEEEIAAMIAQKMTTVTCAFCSRAYNFTPEEIAALRQKQKERSKAETAQE
jgi:molecular chaperone Hsp33